MNAVEEHKPPATAEEMASILGCSTRMVHTMAATGRIPYLRVGKRRRYEPVRVFEALREETSAADVSGPWSTIHKTCEHRKVEAMKR
jgi:excisionase family DNA binding protein